MSDSILARGWKRIAHHFLVSPRLYEGTAADEGMPRPHYGSLDKQNAAASSGENIRMKRMRKREDGVDDASPPQLARFFARGQLMAQARQLGLRMSSRKVIY